MVKCQSILLIDIPLVSRSKLDWPLHQQWVNTWLTSRLIDKYESVTLLTINWLSMSHPSVNRVFIEMSSKYQSRCWSSVDWDVKGQSKLWINTKPFNAFQSCISKVSKETQTVLLKEEINVTDHEIGILTFTNTTNAPLTLTSECFSTMSLNCFKSSSRY